MSSAHHTEVLVMPRVLGSKFAVAAVGLAALVGVSLVAPSAGAADPTVTITDNLDASTHLNTLNQDVKIPRGTMTATINLATGALTGNITLPPATVTLRQVGLPIATATMAIAQTKPVTGHVDLTTFHVTATSIFNIKVLRASPALLPFVNLVGNQCTTAQPVSVTMSGTADLTGPSTFTGTYTIPKFKTCQGATLALDVAISGPGNTFTATATPKA
jgi:hypothetical protein